MEVNIDDFERMVYYHSTIERYHLGRSLRLYPYLAYSRTDSSVALYGYLHTATSSWLLLNGAVVLVGGRRFTYTPNPNTVSDIRGHEVGNIGEQVACVEWLHIRARTRDSTLALFEAIAAAPETTKVRIRAEGEESSIDWELTDLERRAWQDAVYYYSHFNRRDRNVSAFIR